VVVLANFFNQSGVAFYCFGFCHPGIVP
jgi:hypothetical protein